MNVIDKVVWRNNALWTFLTGTDEEERKAAFVRAFGEPCKVCNGTGSSDTGTNYGGWSESVACDACDGIGATDRDNEVQK